MGAFYVHVEALKVYHPFYNAIHGIVKLYIWREPFETDIPVAQKYEQES